MKTRFIAAVLACCLSFSPVVLAQSSKGGDKKGSAPKAPPDPLLEPWTKARNDPAAKTAAGFANVIAVGMDFLVKNPTHAQVNTVINQLAGIGNQIDSKQPALRTSYLSLLKFEITNQRYKDEVTDPVKAMLAALDATVADIELRQAPGGQTLANLREKLDALADTPGSGRFITDRERSYAHILTLMNQAPRAEQQLKKLTGHPEKNVAKMARDELNILELKKTPFELKFTALDGKEVDLAKLRGKAVALYIWSTTNKASADGLERLKILYSGYRKQGFEVITASYDKEEDRAKVQKFVKDNRITWPVYFDGKAEKGEFSQRLNAANSNLPRVYLFDKAGILQTVAPNNSTVLQPTVVFLQMEPHVKRLVSAK